MSAIAGNKAAEDPVLQWVTFRLENESYGINVMQVQEVLRYSEIAPVPGAPPYVLGIINLRGNVVTVIDTADGNIMLSLDGGCNGCSSTPMTAMQIFYSLMKLDAVNDVIFVNGELPEYMRDFIKKKMEKEAAQNLTSGDGHEPRGEII